MQKLFNKIIVPVDFTASSKLIVDTAVDMAANYHCSIHLIHVIATLPFPVVSPIDGQIALYQSMVDTTQDTEFKLKKLCDYAILKAGKSVHIEYAVLTGTWDEAIIEYIGKYDFDLMLIGQGGKGYSKRKIWINPDKVAEETNIPVITIPLNKRLVNLYSIVIPITDFLPVRKLLYGVYIASKFNTTVRLVGIENEKTREKVQYYLRKAYRLIRDNCTVKVELETIANANVADAVNQYAFKKSADLIIVNPGTQTKMPGFFASLLGKVIQKYAAPPVLTVSPG